MLRDAASENNLDALVLSIHLYLVLPQNMFVVIMKIVCNSHLMVVICNVECVQHVSSLELDRPSDCYTNIPDNKIKRKIHSIQTISSEICVRFEFSSFFVHPLKIAYRTSAVHSNQFTWTNLFKGQNATRVKVSNSQNGHGHGQSLY